MVSLFSTTPENRSLSDNGRYLTYIQNVLNRPTLDGFKHHPDYNLILEHATYEHGAMYLKVVQDQTPDLLDCIDKFKINDIIGNNLHTITGHPTYCSYGQVKDITPSTLRYIKTASDLKYYFDTIGENIAEIGGGYGGQCLVLDQLFSWNKYYLFDLDLPLQLTTRYLENFILNSSYACTTLNQYSGTQLDFVLSTVAFSELPSKVQVKYLEKVLSRSKRGYLLMNSGFDNAHFKGDFLSIEQIQSYLPLSKVLPATPLELWPYNKIIIWGHKN